MAHAEKCPVCLGSGTIVIVGSTGTLGSAYELPRKTCHGCDGRGWVTVGVEYPGDSRLVDPLTGNVIKTFKE